MPYDIGAFQRSGLQTQEAVDTYASTVGATNSSNNLLMQQNQAQIDSKSYLDNLMKQVANDPQDQTDPGVPDVASATPATSTSQPGAPANLGGAPSSPVPPTAPIYGATGLGGMQQGTPGTPNQVGPNGFQQPTATNQGGMQKPQGPAGAVSQPAQGQGPVGATQQQPQAAQAAPTPLAQKVREGQQALTAEKKLTKVYEKAITQAMKDGKSDVVAALMTQLTNQKQQEFNTETAHIKNTEAQMEFGGRLAQGYLDGITQDPGQEAMLWNNLVNSAVENGYPGTELQQAKTPQQHQAVATQLKGMGMKSADEARIQQQQAKMGWDKYKFQVMQDFKVAHAAQEENDKATDREYKHTEDALKNKQALRKEDFANLSKVVEIEQKDVSRYDTEIAELNKSRKDLADVTALAGASGMLGEDPRAHQIEILDQKIAQTTAWRDAATGRVKQGEGLLREAGGVVPKAAPATAAKPAAAKPAAKTVPEDPKTKAEAFAMYQHALQDPRAKDPATRARIEKVYKEDLAKLGA